MTKEETILNELIKSAFNSSKSISYHGSNIKIEINLNRDIKESFFYYLLNDVGTWNKVTKEEILNNL